MNFYFGTYLLLVVIFLSSCSIDVNIRSKDLGSIEQTNTFDANNLDFSNLSKSVHSSSTTADGELHVQLDMKEYIYNNKVKFINIPEGAQLICDGADPNVALQTLDLTNEKSFSLRYNYWVATASEWTDLQSLSFSCWYEVAGISSAKIHFGINLQEETVVRVSVPTFSGTETHGESDEGVISGDGRFVAFSSFAVLDESDLNGSSDIFVRDLTTREITRVSVSSSGEGGNKDSEDPAISADGRYIAFISAASNLVAGDSNGLEDVFVHDRQTATTKRISVDSSGVQADSDSTSVAISANGRYVTFRSYASNLVAGDTNGLDDIFVHDLETATTSRVSVSSSGTEGNGNVSNPSISSDGRFVIFTSQGSSLVTGDTNFTYDVFLHDRQTATTERISVDSLGNQANGESSSPHVSGDGRYITFHSDADNLVAGDTNGSRDIFLHDRQSGATSRISVSSSGTQADASSYSPFISQDGSTITYFSYATDLVADDTNSAIDAFTYKVASGETRLISRDINGVPGNNDSTPSHLSSDGRYIVVLSNATDFFTGDTSLFYKVYAFDTLETEVSLASFESLGGEANYWSLEPAISADGRYVCFETEADNLVANDTNVASDIFVHDRKTGVTTRVSVDSSGAEGDANSYSCSINGDGRFVSFMSYATNLVPGDTNWQGDIFVHDRQTGTTTRVSLGEAGAETDGESYYSSLSLDGRYLAYQSSATNIVPGDTNGQSDIFVHDLQLATTTRVSVSGLGAQSDGWSDRPKISPDGRYVIFNSSGTTLVAGDTNARRDIFLHDLQLATTTRISVTSGGVQANGHSTNAAISENGRYIVFDSTATNLVAGDTNARTDIFVHDTQTATTTLISKAADGGLANNNSEKPAIDRTGRFITFASVASNITTADTNAAADIFLFDQNTGESVRVSLGTEGQEGNYGSYTPAISADGRYIVTSSYASNLVSGDSNSADDIFIFKR